MGNVNCLRCHFRHEDNGNCTAVGGFCTAVPAAHCPLLRQYLDTGMTPEAFQSFVVFFQDLIGNQKASEALDNFRQLVKSNRDGRLLVLPCKVGDTVWAVSGKIIKCEIGEAYLCGDGGIEYIVTFDCDGSDCEGCPFSRWERDCFGECYCECEYGCCACGIEKIYTHFALKQTSCFCHLIRTQGHSFAALVSENPVRMANRQPPNATKGGKLWRIGTKNC